MIQEKIIRLRMQIADLNNEIKFYEAVLGDYVLGSVKVCNVRTDAVYEDFCRRHPDITISQRRFTNTLCKALGLKSVQSRLDGVRGSFYDRT